MVNGDIYAVEFGYDLMETVVKRYDAKSYAKETLNLFDEACREILVMLLLAAICISIAMAERFEAVENKREKIADMLEGRNDAFKEAT